MPLNDKKAIGAEGGAEIITLGFENRAQTLSAYTT